MPSTERTLSGVTVVVTRAAEQGRRFVELLTGLGAEVVELPLIEAVDPADGGSALADAIERLSGDDWLIVTSPNGADRVAPHLRSRSESGRAGPRLAAVGGATAAALGSHVAVDVLPERSIAEGLVVALEGVGPAHALLVQGDRARPVLADGLRAAGWTVDQVVAYRTVASRPADELLRRALAADAITFASGSTVESFVDAAGSADRHPPVVVSIGPATTAVADRLGVAVTATAEPHSLSGMVDALVAALGRRIERA